MDSGTPVITAGLHYDLIDGVNCLHATNIQSFVSQVAKLKSDPSLWTTLSEGGFRAAEEHSIQVSGEHLLAGLEHTLLNN